MGEPFRYQLSEHERCDRSSMCCLTHGHAGPCVCDACTFPMLEHTDDDLAECVEILEEIERDVGAARGGEMAATGETWAHVARR